MNNYTRKRIEQLRAIRFWGPIIIAFLAGLAMSGYYTANNIGAPLDDGSISDTEAR